MTSSTAPTAASLLIVALSHASGAVPAAATCGSVRAALLADLDGRADCDTPLLAGACAGLTADACVEELYAAPQALGPGSGTLQVAFLPPCEGGGESCEDGDRIRCIDGTRPAVYWKAATPGPSTRWMFFLGGEGGPCSASIAPGDCLAQLTAGGADGNSLTSLNATQFSSRGGMFEWEGFHRVIFEKCHVGEADGGDLVDSATGGSGFTYTYTEFHHGRRIWNTLFSFLAESNETTLPDLDDATQILLVGHSDGAKGLIYTGDSLRDTLRAQTANSGLDVRLALAGHFVPFIDAEHAVGNGNPSCQDLNGNGVDDLYDHCELPGELPPDGEPSEDGFSDAAYRPGGRVFDTNVGHGAEIDASCLALIFSDDFESGDLGGWNGPGHREQRCHSEMHVLLEHLAVPTFVHMDLLDSAWLGAATQHAADPSYRLPNQQFANRVRRIAQDWLDYGAELADESPPVVPAFYIPSVGGPESHNGLTQTPKFLAEELQQCQGGNSVATWSTEELLEAWLGADPLAPSGDYQALYERLPDGSGSTWVGASDTCP